MRMNLSGMLVAMCLSAVMAGCGGGGGGDLVPTGPTALSINTLSLPAATQNAAYTASVVASGGTAPYTFSVVGNGVAGLALSPTNGVLAGTPTATGSFPITVQVADSGTPPASVTRAFTLTVAPQAAAGLEITTPSLPSATVGAPISAVILATGGTEPYNFSLTTGTTAQGIGLSQIGQLSGTVAVQGNYVVVVRVTDQSFPQKQATRTYSLAVNPVGGGGGGTPLTITTASMPAGQVSSAYTASVAATGGIQPYTYTMTSAAIPGLTFTGTTLAGTPTLDGSYQFQIQVTDSAVPPTVQVATFTVVINPLSAADALSQHPTFTAAEAAHLLQRVQWGARPGQATSASAMGLVAYVDSLLNATTDPLIENQALSERIPDPQFPTRNQLSEWWLQLMVRTNNPLQETMAFFWHDLFAASSEILQTESYYWMIDHVNMLRANSLGNLRTFVKALSKDWVMLEWLDGIRSTGARPNENFARELWELFTLGADNGYTEADIQQSMRCFTGFQRLTDTTNPNGNRFYIVFNPNRHDGVNNKTIFGQTVFGKTGAAGVQEYDEVVDITFDHRPVAEFYVKRLWEYFCYENPAQEIIDTLAAQLRAANYEIKPVLRTILLSRAFYSDKSKGSAVEVNGGLMKNPVEYTVGLIRSTGLEIPYATLRSQLNTAGQLPTMPPNVNGWPSGSLWASADGLVSRTNIARDAVWNRTFQNQLGITLDPILPPLGQRTKEAVVDRLAESFGISMTISERNRYLDYLDSDRVNNQVVANPFNGDDPVQVDKKVRGLVYIMAQHPSFHVR